MGVSRSALDSGMKDYVHGACNVDSPSEAPRRSGGAASPRQGANRSGASSEMGPYFVGSMRWVAR